MSPQRPKIRRRIERAPIERGFDHQAAIRPRCRGGFMSLDNPMRSRYLENRQDTSARYWMQRRLGPNGKEPISAARGRGRCAASGKLGEVPLRAVDSQGRSRKHSGLTDLTSLTRSQTSPAPFSADRDSVADVNGGAGAGPEVAS